MLDSFSLDKLSIEVYENQFLDLISIQFVKDIWAFFSHNPKHI